LGRLIKTGAMPKTHEKQIAYLSAYAEFIGYLGSISLSFIKLKELNILEQSLSEKLHKKREVSAKGGGQIDQVGN
jgi:hypothetical protein